MVSVDWIQARAYARATEVVARVRQAVLNVFPEEIRGAAHSHETSATGYSHDPITVVEVTLRGKEECSTAFNDILRRLGPSDCVSLDNTLDRRLDEDCTLFIRLAKQEAYRGVLQLGADSDVISLRIHIVHRGRCPRDELQTVLKEQIERKGL